MALARLEKLERTELAAAAGSGQGMISPEAEPVLRNAGRHIIKTVHRAFTGRVDGPLGDALAKRTL